jgi:hypothetical protein
MGSMERRLSMRTKLIGAAALGAVLLTGGIAYAASEAGEMTRAEATAKAREKFAKMDANKDGKLDAADRAVHHGQIAAAMFDRVDADKNGSISREEWSAGATRLAEAHGDGGPRHMLRMRRPVVGLMQADADGDRAITVQEMEAAALKRFDAADADGNGTLSPGERQAARGLTRLQVERD